MFIKDSRMSQLMDSPVPPPAVDKQTTSSGHTVALIDTLWYGHHATYFKEMASALASSGVRVLAICPEVEDCRESLQEMLTDTPEAMDRIQFASITHGKNYLPGRDHDPISTHLRWKRIAATMQKLEADSGWKVDMAFFPKLDSMFRFASPSVPNCLGTLWSGIYFQHYHLLTGKGLLGKVQQFLKGDPLLRNKNISIVGQLDERPTELLSDQYGIESLLFPDITDETPPEGETQLSRSIREKSKGRTIIGLISLEPRKGFIEMLNLAELADPEKFYFVFTGPFQREWVSEEQMARITKLQEKVDSGEIDHIFFDTSGQRIPDGTEYNAVFSAFDIAWALYPGFQCSSNALTKAAVFQKLLIAEPGTCIGKRVQDFDMGAQLEAGDVQAGLQVIDNLADGKNEKGDPLNPRFSDYHQLHSRERLRDCLLEVLEKSVTTA